MWWMALVIQPLCTAAQADPPQYSSFAVGAIRVEGLQRLSEGAVLTHLPVNIGDRLNGARVGEAIRALYATGLFRDVELRRDGDTLWVVIAERPMIARFEIRGNKDIKTEDLQKNLRKVGLAYGKTFDRAVLEDVQQYLTDLYFSRGKYGVHVATKVAELRDNEVSLVIDIKEGKRAKIEQINLVGITRFKEKDVLRSFELKTPNWLSWYKQDDRYSRETLNGDLERLRSYYMDRGYANFQVESTQVAIAPDMEDMYITVNVTEGEAFKVSRIKLTGPMVVPEAQLRKLLVIKPGDTYSRKAVTRSQESMIYRLGTAGYAFAKVNPVLTADRGTKTASITFFIEPGERVYVRHINFNNVSHIRDETLRREMRQLEGGILSNAAVERSKMRLQRLLFVEKVDFEIKPVPGRGDLADVDFDIKEGLWGQAGGGLGYSQTQSFGVNVDAALNNVLGAGDRLFTQVNVNRYNKAFVLAHTDPYTTIDGVSRTLSLTYREGTRFVTAASNLSTEQLSAGSTWTYPITEYQTVQLGVSADEARLLTTRGFSSLESVDWVKSNGNPYFSRDFEPNVSYYYYGTRFNTYEGNAGWGFDSLNRALFPDRGLRASLTGRITVPGSDVNYYTLNSDFLQYVPLWRDSVLSLHGTVNYGSPLGSTTSLPPYLNYFAGGVDSVRGYRDSTLGPRDNIGNGNPYGGNLRIVGNVEVILPVPEKLRTSFRVSLFYDIGNVFQTGSSVEFKGVDKYTPVEYQFNSWSDLKRSTGVALQWLAPLGFFRLSFGIPLNARRGDLVNYGDSTERIQFSVGQAFNQTF